MRRKPPPRLETTTLAPRHRSGLGRSHPWGSLASLGHLTELGASPRRVMDRLCPRRGDGEDM